VGDLTKKSWQWFYTLSDEPDKMFACLHLKAMCPRRGASLFAYISPQLDVHPRMGNGMNSGIDIGPGLGWRYHMDDGFSLI
jgi:hypothetical protein